MQEKTPEGRKNRKMREAENAALEAEAEILSTLVEEIQTGNDRLRRGAASADKL